MVGAFVLGAKLPCWRSVGGECGTGRTISRVRCRGLRRRGTAIMKERFPAECRGYAENRRADVLFGRTVYEFNIPLEPSEYTHRTYGILAQNGDTTLMGLPTLITRNVRSTDANGGYMTFRWKWPKRRLECVPTISARRRVGTALRVKTHLLER